MNANIIENNMPNNYYLDLFSKNGFASCIHVYTRLPNGQYHTWLDHIFVSNNEHLIALVNTSILQLDITDPYSTFVSVSINTLSTTKSKYIYLIDDGKLKNVLGEKNGLKCLKCI